MIKKDEQKKEQPIKLSTKMTDQELYKFNQSVQKYYQEKKLSTGQKVRVWNYYDFMLENGGMNKRHEILATTNDDGSVNVSKWLMLEDRIDQWKNWLSRKEYGKRKRDEQLNQQSMEVSSKLQV